MEYSGLPVEAQNGTLTTRSKPTTMLNKSKLIGFVATAKPAKAKAFYGDTLGLTLVEDGPYALVFNANGTMLRVQKVEELSPAGYTMTGWDVSDIHATVQQLAKKGVRFERYEFLTQDELGIWASPAGAQVAWFKDPDGNILSLTEFGKTNHDIPTHNDR